MCSDGTRLADMAYPEGSVGVGGVAGDRVGEGPGQQDGGVEQQQRRHGAQQLLVPHVLQARRAQSAERSRPQAFSAFSLGA